MTKTKYIVVSTTKDYTGQGVYSSSTAATHETEALAIQEAHRLATNNPARDFFVMKSVMKLYAIRPVAAERVPMTNTFKDTNPKDAVGTKKAPLSTVSAPVLLEIGTAMLEGARKYGRHNYRIADVRASVYYDATMRHLMSWFEGEDLDPDSGLSHITKALASLCVLRDAQINDGLVDDRPPSSKPGWKDKIQENVDEIFQRYPDSKEAFTITSSKS